MSLFFNKDKTLKSPLLLSCFSLGMAYHVIFGILYVILSEPLYRYVRIGSDEFSTMIHAMLIALAGTAVCCLFFGLRDKRIVPGAFVFLAVSLICGYLVTLSLPADRRSLMISLITLYGSGPVVLGNAVSWSIYLQIRRKKRQMDGSSLNLQGTDVRSF